MVWSLLLTLTCLKCCAIKADVHCGVWADLRRMLLTAGIGALQPQSCAGRTGRCAAETLRAVGLTWLAMELAWDPPPS